MHLSFDQEHFMYQEKALLTDTVFKVHVYQYLV